MLADFERNRMRLQKLAKRILGDAGEAEEVVQEAWLRLLRGRPDDVRSLSAWLTTVVTRLCLDALRARRRQHAERISMDASVLDVPDSNAGTPEQHVVLADSVGVALLVILERLNPAERVAFVLHDVFDLPFDEIAPLIDRSEDAVRQLASRARRRVRGTGDRVAGNTTRHRQLAEKFLTAARTGDLEALVKLLDPNIALRPDDSAARMGPGGEIRSAEKVASFFINRGAAAAHVALIDGHVGILVAPGGRLLLVIRPAFDGQRIIDLEVIADSETLAALTIALAPGWSDLPK